MNAQKTLSEKGQVAIPKDVRDSLGFVAGQKLDAIRSGNSVSLKPIQQKSGRTVDKNLTHLRAIAPIWEGPSVSIKDMNAAVDAMFAARSKDDI